MKRITAVFVLLIGLFAIPAQAQKSEYKASQLLDECRIDARITAASAAGKNVENTTPSEAISIGFCIGFIVGVTDGELGTYSVVDGVVYVLTTPEGYTSGQLTKVFMKYMETHPEMLDKEAEIAILYAVLDARILRPKEVGKLVPSSPKGTTSNAAAPTKSTT
jgi:hypothetical protein